MSLEKFSVENSKKVRITEDEKEVLEELEEKCQEKGINHKMFLKKVTQLYKLR